MIGADMCDNCGRDIQFKQDVSFITDNKKKKTFWFCDDECAQSWAKKNNIRAYAQ